LLESGNEALKLYDYAVKNKIGLLYLKTIKDQGKLEDFRFVSKYKAECEKHNEQLITLNRIAKFLNSLNMDYAIFKSIMPYPATPNDIDILCFGSDDEYKKVVNILFQNGYEKPEGGSGPFVIMVHDTRNGAHPDPHEKDVYDIDLYREVAITHIVYLDKRKLVKHVTEMNILNEKVKVLRPEAELVASITHSIIPEQLCTLFIYYATLYYFEKMNSEGIEQLINIAKENNVTFPIRAHCSLVGELHQAVHGFVPEKINRVLAKLGNETTERNTLLKNNFKMPHHYNWFTVIRTLLELAKGEEFRKSVIVQAINMLNPRFGKYVFDQLIWRRERETY